ncbi:hypothetical protein PC39_04357 [Salinisphaera sp. PC39]|uniref:L-histidine N(alpha)-methyltransferase n=1 Tax=Salinisphaera sp. PC39 TaxID=1304156 RepID=UPI00333E4085
MDQAIEIEERLTCTPVAPERPLPTLADDVRRGLLAPPRWLPPKYFYDDAGSRLFDALCDTPEYYPTRTEDALLRAHAGDIVGRVAPAHLLELGSGTARKTRHLLDACEGRGVRPVYWPLDVCAEMLDDSGRELVSEYPWLRVNALVGDYNGGLGRLPLPAEGRRLVAFLGGTIGNFAPDEAVAALCEIGTLLRPGDRLLLGADRVKDPAVLEAAYDDAQGLTAAFNRNVLNVLNRELDADFPVADYRHRARFDRDLARIEMRLCATRDHTVRLGRLDAEIAIAAGEEILTEISRKFTPESLAAMLAEAGLTIDEHYEAPGGAYSLVLAAPAG